MRPHAALVCPGRVARTRALRILLFDQTPLEPFPCRHGSGSAVVRDTGDVGASRSRPVGLRGLLERRSSGSFGGSAVLVVETGGNWFLAVSLGGRLGPLVAGRAGGERVGASVGSQLVHCARRATGRAVVPLGRSAERSGVGAVVTLFAGSRSGFLPLLGRVLDRGLLLGARVGKQDPRMVGWRSADRRVGERRAAWMPG